MTVRVALAVVAYAAFVAGSALLIYAAWAATRPTPRRRRRRVRHHDRVPDDRSRVVDGYTRPSSTVAALCAEPLPSERQESA